MICLNMPGALWYTDTTFEVGSQGAVEALDAIWVFMREAGETTQCLADSSFLAAFNLSSTTASFP